MLLEKHELVENLGAQGFTIRPASLRDLDSIVTMCNAAAEDLIGVDDKIKAHDIQREWGLPGFNLETDTRVVIAPDGNLVGYYEVWDINKPNVNVHCWGRVHPDYTGMGAGSALLAWAESRARQVVPEAPTGARVAMLLAALSKDGRAQDLFENSGFELIRHSLRMVIELDGPPRKPNLPEGITVRTLRVGEEERAVLQAVRESFKDHWGYVERPFEDEYQQWMHLYVDSPDYDPSLWFLAVHGEEIAGVSLCRPKSHEDEAMGWVGTLGVRRPWRRRGIALALLQHSFGEFYRRGKRKVGLGVDAQSLTGATRLYEKAGMQSDPERQFTIYEKELRPGRDISKQTLED